MSLREEKIFTISELLGNTLLYFTIPSIDGLNKDTSEIVNELKKEIDFNFRKLIDFLSMNYKYVSTSNLNLIADTLLNLITLTNDIIKNPPENGKNSSEFKKLKTYINYILYEIVDEYEYDFSHKYTIKEINELLEILDDLSEINEINFPKLIINSYKKLEDKNISLDVNTVAETCINTINLIINKKLYEAKLFIKDIFNMTREIELIYEENKLQETAENINKTTEQTVRQLNLSQNLGLITLFNEEAIKYESKLQLYSYAIIFLFCIIVCSIFLKLVLSSEEFHLNKSIIFIALITSLSAFLAYFIKERSRLYNLETYCRKSYLELSALSPYMAELTPEQRQSLRIELAGKYFKGHENIDTNTENTSQISMFSEIIKTLNELKPKL
ncbi:hypothetical protein BAX55_16015 [Acinetobacter baumannii]|nr:hypothetical protein BAX55_16015 [Acinetobacter baumannii]